MPVKFESYHTTLALGTMDPRHKIMRVPSDIRDCTCKTSVYIVNPHQFGYPVQTHAFCGINELTALRNRHLVDRTYIDFRPELWRLITRLTMKYYPSNVTPVTFGAVIDGYVGAKKRNYIAALSLLQSTGFKSQYATIQMFVKPDRYSLDAIAEKAPRAIQYRHPIFNLMFSRYTKALEEELYPTLTYGVISDTRVVAKGLNNYERAAIIIDKSKFFQRPYYLMLDHSKFDSTINVDHLKSTHRKYQKAFRSRTLHQLCKEQLENKGYSSRGIKYRAKGTRMSGDADTALGNTIINCDALWGFLFMSGITKYDMLVDGDDSIVIIEQDDAKACKYKVFDWLGFETKHEETDVLEHVEFCQSRIVIAQEPCFIRNPKRVLAHTQSMRTRPNNHDEEANWLAGVGMCELACNRGIPVLESFAKQLRSLSNNPKLDPDYAFRWDAHKSYLDKEVPVTPQARMSFERAWGIPIATQLLLEDQPLTCLRNRVPCSDINKRYTDYIALYFQDEYNSLTQDE